MDKERGLTVKKLSVQSVRVFLAGRLSFHWREMTKSIYLILASFSRVGLSLPIDGSKDKQIKIQACEHLRFAPILGELACEENSAINEHVEEKRSEPEPTMGNERKYRENILRENIENNRPKVQRARRVLPGFLFSKLASDIDESSYDRYSDHWYSVDSVCSDLDESILAFEEYYDRTDYVFTTRFNELMDEVSSLEDTLKEVCKEVRETISKQPPFEFFTLVSQILMFADPIQDDRINESEIRVNNLDKLC